MASYFFGFYINEDSAGGGKVDLYAHEWGNVQLFVNNSIFDALSDLRYESSRTPLYLIINKYNILKYAFLGVAILENTAFWKVLISCVQQFQGVVEMIPTFVKTFS